MLQRIWVESFLLIDRLDMNWESGLHVLTGETGAGKSMVLEAIACLAGQKADAKWVRPGNTQTEVGAVFSAPYPLEVELWLIEQGFDPDDELWLRRTVDLQGKSKAWINQKPMPVSSLKQCTSALIELGYQHMHLQWLKSDVQREWLDALGGLESQRVDVDVAWQAWQAAQDALKTAQSGQVQRQYEREALIQRREDLDALQPTESAWEEMNHLHTRIAGSADRRERMAIVRRALYDERHAMLDQLHSLMQQLAPIIDQSEAAKAAWELLEQANISMQEAAHTLRHDDEDEGSVDLPSLEAKLSKWHRTARRYHVPPSELYELWLLTNARWKELEALSSIDVFEKAVQVAHSDYQQKAQILTAAREAASHKAEAAIAPWLPRLNLPDARFKVTLKSLAEGGRFGAEQVVMTFQSHPSLPSAPLGETASGGELARIALILALVQHPDVRPPVRFFDEVDTGISGSTVAEVGRLLQHQAQKGQIVCISHQPQMAACADVHWKIEKSSDHPPITRVRCLDEVERCSEIARLMAAGTDDHQSARLHAEQLRQGLARVQMAQP